MGSVFFITGYLLTKISTFFPALRIRRAVKKAGGIHKFLWPSQKEGVFIGMNLTAPTLEVIFPMPPQEVQDLLYKVTQKLVRPDLKLTVDPQAITFVQDPIALMVNAAQKERQAIKERRLAALRADPIVTLTSPNGIVVAVLAQYGDFPIEKEAVMKAVEEFSFA